MSSADTKRVRPERTAQLLHAVIILPDHLKENLGVLNSNVIDIVNRNEKLEGILEDVRVYAWTYLDAITKLFEYVDANFPGAISASLRFDLEELNKYFTDKETTEEQFHLEDSHVKSSIAIFLSEIRGQEMVDKEDRTDEPAVASDEGQPRRLLVIDDAALLNLKVLNDYIIDENTTVEMLARMSFEVKNSLSVLLNQLAGVGPIPGVKERQLHHLEFDSTVENLATAAAEIMEEVSKAPAHLITAYTATGEEIACYPVADVGSDSFQSSVYRPLDEVNNVVNILKRIPDVVPLESLNTEEKAALAQAIVWLYSGEPFHPEPLPESGQGKWRDTAVHMSRGNDYYRGVVHAVGKHLGIEAYTADDGTVSDSVLAAKVADLVKALVEQVAANKVPPNPPTTSA